MNGGGGGGGGSSFPAYKAANGGTFVFSGQAPKLVIEREPGMEATFAVYEEGSNTRQIHMSVEEVLAKVKFWA